MRYILLLFLSGLLGCSSGQISQKNADYNGFLNKKYKNIKIYESKGEWLGPCEPSIYINHKNPLNIVAGSVLDFVHVSFDGGKTWNTNRMKSTYGVFGDPSIVANKNGQFFYFHLSDPDGTNWKSNRILDRMVVQSSLDGGLSWSSGVGINKNSPKQQDKEWATINPVTNEIYLTWTEFDKYGSKSVKDKSRILFSKSSDNGLTWSKPFELSELKGNALDDNRTVEGAVPSVGPNGEIYVAWSYDNNIYFDKSLDDGKTWLSNDILATTQPLGWGFDIPGLKRANGMPITGVDISATSKYKGTVYINFADQRNGTDNTDIFIVKSTDGGNTWCKAIKVNQDNTKSHQFFTWMSVDPVTGYLYIVYYDRSKYKDNRTDVVLAVSKDGGNTFMNKTISQKPFIPNPKVFFGDYNNISAYNGIVRPIWTRFENGKLSVWTALINEK